MAFYDFKQDIKIANKTERKVAQILINVYKAKILHFEDTYKYDILVEIQEKEYTFEIKEDFMCKDTGNVSVEFSFRGNPSGIQKTEADFYLYKIHLQDNKVTYVVHWTRDLIKMINRKKYFRIVNGGDKGSDSLNYLFKYEMFIKFGTILPLDKL